MMHRLDQDGMLGRARALLFSWLVELAGLLVALLAGSLAIIVYALQHGLSGNAVRVAAIGMMAAAASSLLGGLLGFVFGIPRTLQGVAPTPPPPVQPTPSDASGNVQASASAPSIRPAYVANTNLEQISDWLTKILVGVSLTQVPQITQALHGAAEVLATALGSAATDHAFAFALIIFFLICGFLLGYLWTRLYLPSALSQSDLAAAALVKAQVAEKKADEAAEGLRGIREQQLVDARALAALQRQLEPAEGDPGIEPAKLNDVISNASPAVQAHILAQAQAFRKQTWEHEKQKMERTIPIFESVLRSKFGRTNHRAHGQLGYALKDRLNNDRDNLHRAIAEFDEAIRLRGDPNVAGGLLYEFNRAACRILLDRDYCAIRPCSNSELHKAILADLELGVHSDMIRGILLRDVQTQQWLRLNAPDLLKKLRPEWADDGGGADAAAVVTRNAPQNADEH